MKMAPCATYFIFTIMLLQRSDCFKQSLSTAYILVQMKLFLLYFIAAIAAILYG